MKKTRYEIFPEAKTMVEYLAGPISWSDYSEMKKQELSDPRYNSSYNVINDMRDVCVNKEDFEGLNRYVEFFEANKLTIGCRNSAVLTENSKQVVYSELFKSMIDHLPIDLKTVSTYEAAFEWTRLNQTARLKAHNYIEELREATIKVPCGCKPGTPLCSE